jgi:hypothetical protein
MAIWDVFAGNGSYNSGGPGPGYPSHNYMSHPPDDFSDSRGRGSGDPSQWSPMATRYPPHGGPGGGYGMSPSGPPGMGHYGNRSMSQRMSPQRDKPGYMSPNKMQVWTI